jgi:predicted MPP superfamily phosphohydrolase
LRLVHLSDLQPAQVGPHERRAFRAAVALRPDVICITGDFVDGRPAEKVSTLTADLFAAMREERLAAPLGLFVVLGDTDGGNADLRPALAGLGAITLSDEVAQRSLPNGRLAVIGLSNSWSRGADPDGLRRLVASAPETDLRIVLGHRPDYVRHLAGQARVDLCLAGHTHGGQVVLPWLGPPVTLMTLPRRFAAGLNDLSGVPLHVSRGIGMERGVAPQIRFLCPPEVCLIDLHY